MVVFEQAKLFTDEIFEQISHKLNAVSKQELMPVHEDTLLNNRVIPLMKAAGISLTELKVCVRDIYDHWMVIEAATLTSSVSMTIWNNDEADYIHWLSDNKTKAFEKHYFHNRYNPAKVFYLEKKLEQNARNFFN